MSSRPRMIAAAGWLTAVALGPGISHAEATVSAPADPRRAEAEACAGIPERDHGESPFARSVEAIAAEPLYEVVRPGPSSSVGPAVEALRGARLSVRAAPGVTVEWLQHVVNCHLARTAALGHEPTQMPRCPLALRGATATVRSGGDRLIVEVRARNPSAAAEIWKRAHLLAAR